MLEVLSQTLNGIASGYRDVGNISTAGALVSVLINVLLGVTFALSIVGIAYSFFLFVISAGDKDAVKKAQTSLTWSIGVLVLSFLAITLKNILFTLLRVNPTINTMDYEY